MKNNIGNQIKLRHIRYFLAAADYGSFRKAGGSLGLRESAISRSVRDLEDQLGASLFIRHSGGVKLTVAGQRFLRRMRIAFRQIEESARDIAAIGNAKEGCIKIGITYSFISGFLFELLQSFRREHPAVRLELFTNSSSELISAICHFELDIAFVAGTAGWTECETEHLWAEQLFAVLPSDHKLAAKEKLDWADFLGENFVVNNATPGPEFHDYLVQRLSYFGHHSAIIPQYVEHDNLLSIVATGGGLAIINEAATRIQIPGIAYRPISDEIIPFSTVWSPKNDNPAFRCLLSLARSTARRASAIASPVASMLPSDLP